MALYLSVSASVCIILVVKFLCLRFQCFVTLVYKTVVLFVVHAAPAYQTMPPPYQTGPPMGADLFVKGVSKRW